MNERLFDDVFKLLSGLEGMNYKDARILLETALKVLESNCYLELNPTQINKLKEELKNGN